MNSEEENKPIVEGLKELLRLILIFFIPEAFEYITKVQLDPLAKLAIIAILKGLDKFIHKTGEEIDNEFLEKGLTRF